jgi:hypothetical protein
MKFIYLADTHIGASNDTGYRKQARYLNHFQELIECLGKYIKTSGDIDYIIHGGDIVDNTTHELIIKATYFFDQLPCPTYLVLGNHDLTVHNSLDMWLEYAPQFFPDGKPNFRLVNNGVQIDALVCNWCELPAYWNPEKQQIPWLSATQLAQITNLKEGCYTQLVITHSPVYGLPPEQHGGNGIMHAPQGGFSEKLLGHLNCTSLVLGAHNHMNMSVKRDDCCFATVAAFSETPFEFKLIEVTPQKLSMQTLQLGHKISFSTEYDIDSAYVQGRQCDRSFKRKLL